MPQHQISLTSYTGRLSLVPPSLADDERVIILQTHPEIRRYLRFFPKALTPEQIRLDREKQAEDSHIIRFNMHATQSDGSTVFAGMGGIHSIDEDNGSCEAGILVSPDLHRGGVATDTLYTILEFAFEDRHMHRVSLKTGVDNIGMRKWLEKVAEAGYEGKKREIWKNQDGSYSDVVEYSILEGEWRQRIRLALQNRLSSRKVETSS